MPRVTGPLFSASASGTFSDLMEFRMIGNKSVVTRPKTGHRPVGPVQASHAERFKRASGEWKKLSADTKTLWKNKAVVRKLTGYQLYIREYLVQGIVPPSQPILPS